MRMLKPRLGGPPSKARSYSMFSFFSSFFLFSSEMKKSGVSLLGVIGWMQESLFGLGSFGLEVGWGFDVKL